MRTLAGLDQFRKYMSVNENAHDDDDLYLDWLIAATSTLEDETNRELTLTEREEFLDGNGESSIRVSKYPIVNPDSLQIWDSVDRVFDDDTLINAEEYVVEKESGRIILIDQTFQEGTKNIKVKYKSGYSKFIIKSKLNDTLVVNEGSDDIEINIAVDRYNAISLAEEIQTKLNNHADTTQDYTVTYSLDSQRFLISSTGEFSIQQNSYILVTIGFADESKSGDSAYLADYARAGAPKHLKDATILLAEKKYKNSPHGEGRAGIKSQSGGDHGVDTTYLTGPLPPFVQRIVKNQRKLDK